MYLVESDWTLHGAIERYPEVDFHFTSELEGSKSRDAQPEWQAAAGS